MASTNRLSPIPHPPTKPVIGNMLSLDSTAPVQHLVRLTKELGPIFWLDMMGAPLVIVSGHDPLALQRYCKEKCGVVLGVGIGRASCRERV